MRDDDRALAGLFGLGLAHDLRNLLSVAETSAFIATRALPTDVAKAATHLARISDTMREAQALLTATLALGRGEPIAAAPHAVVELVTQAARQVGSAKIAIEPIDDDLRASVSRALAIAALANVLRNASEAAATAVHVRARLEGDRVAVEVIDDGAGFPPGFEIAAGATTKRGGQGLGLAMARASLAAMGAEIEVGARSDGERGAAVRVAFQP